MKRITYISLLVLLSSVLLMLITSRRHSIKYHPEDDGDLMAGFGRIKEQFQHNDYFAWLLPVEEVVRFYHQTPIEVNDYLVGKKYTLVTHKLTDSQDDYYEWDFIDTSERGYTYNEAEVRYTKHTDGNVEVEYSLTDLGYDRIFRREIIDMGFKEEAPITKGIERTEYFTSEKLNSVVFIQQEGNKSVYWIMSIDALLKRKD